MSEPQNEAQSTRANWLLGLGAAVGLLFATAGILETAPGVGGVPDGAAAVVNGTIIRESNYQRALSALARDSRDPLSEEDRVYILNRLIEEELLVQRASDLGLDRTDPVVRNTLVSAMIETIVSGVGQTEPSDEEVAAFYEQNREFFARTDRFWVRELRFRVSGGNEEEARATAEEATRRLRAGEALSLLARELGAGDVLRLPDGYLPAAKLREYLGPTPARRATELRTGEVSDPVRGGSAYHVLQMVDHTTSPPLPLEAVDSQVRAEMRRRAGDDSLRAYLDQLRDDADVRLPAT
ncbi:MAG: peptidylprolyl isomerase [Myxococcota bacterium]|nr:peptidylprolyl isomerase [Myxococcota bacterium]